MASVVPPPSAPAKLDAALEQELGKATGRIRFNDLLAGGLTLAVLTLAFAAGAILLDRWLVLPEWVRQALLGGFVVAFAAVGYFALVRPWRRAVNPRFAARRVEETLPDTKNAFINWVDLRDKNLPAGVRAAVGTRAVEGVAGADVNKAVESKRVVWLAAAAGLLVAVLAVLFVVFKPDPFLSLVRRAFNPFTVTRIATRTELSIEEPQGGDATVTAGDPVTVRVYVGGSVPDPAGPDRVRLRVRYNPEVPEYDELPLEPGGSAREWVLRVPQSVVQNGFWYTVAGGDAETAEHRVTVRSRPLFLGEFEARYVHPAYTRAKPEVAHERALWGYRGTEVTLTAKTNRQVKRGWLQIDGQPEPIPGQIVGEARDSLQFRLTLKDPGSYRLGFTSADDEPSEPVPPYPIKIAEDLKPWLTITAPAEDDIPLPANGQLRVDGTLGDDFGLTSAALAMQVLDEGAKVLHKLKPKPYREGKSFRREADGTYPTNIDYKDSVALSSLVDADGKPVQLTEKMVLEYWLEATDNCTEPKPNVGKSAVKRVRIVPPPKEPEKQQQQKQAQQQRGQEEQQFQQQQDQQLQNEKRDPPPPLHQQEQEKPKTGEGEKQEPKSEQSTKPTEGNPNGGQKTGSKDGNSGEQPMPPEASPPKPMSEPNKPNSTPETGTQSSETNKEPPSEQQPKPGENTTQDAKKDAAPPQTQNDQKKAEQQARDVQNALDQQNRQPGDGRNQGTDQAQAAEPPADKKPAGRQGEQSEPKAGQPTDPQGQPMGKPSAESKPAGNMEQPKPADAKPEPKPADANPQQSNAGSETTGNTPKNPPIAGNTPAQERPQPANPAQPKEPTDSGTARGKEPPSEGQPKQPAGETKPKPEAARGQERPAENTGTDPANAQERPAEARGAKPADPGQSKKPSTDNPPNQTPAAGEKPQPGAEGSNPQQSPSAAKPEGASKTSPAAGQPNPADKGAEKSAQPESAGQGQKKVDPKEIAQAAKDLASNDPQKQQAARDKLDKMMGKEARQQAERDAKQLSEDLQSSDPAKRQAAEQKLKELAKQAGQQGGTGQGEKKIDPKEIEQAAKDLASGDPQKQQAARDKLDKMMGKGAREQAEREAKQLTEDLQSSDANKRQAAQQKLNDLAKQAEQQAGRGGQEPEPKVDPKEIEKAAQDLASGDPQKQQAARDKLDKMMGKEARQQAEREARQLTEDLKSSDPAKRQVAEQKLKELAKRAGQSAEPKDRGTPLSDAEKQKLAEKARDLTSDDPAKRQAAEKEFDKALGQENREQLQEMARDMQSGDPKKQEAARKKLDQMMKNAPNGAQGQQPSPEEVQKWADKAKDLNSPDPKTREAAEKEFDKQFGKDMRDQLQQAMKDPKKAEEASKKLNEMAGKFNKDFRPGGGASRGREGSLHKDDPRNRLKTAELQLTEFEKNKHNKDLQNKLGWTQEEYDHFLAEQQKRVAQLREEVAKQERPETAPPPTTPPTLHVGEGSGGTKVQTRPDGTAGTSGGAGPGTAPAGYSDAQRKFAEEAAKLRKGQDKK